MNFVAAAFWLPPLQGGGRGSLEEAQVPLVILSEAKDLEPSLNETRSGYRDFQFFDTDH
jgi:hypothetical protein